MNKVELAKMVGLELDYCQWDYNGDTLDSYFNQYDDSFKRSYFSHSFCEGKIMIEVELPKDKYLTCNQVVYETIVWERAADKYLEMVHNAAMMIGGK